MNMRSFDVKAVGGYLLLEIFPVRLRWEPSIDFDGKWTTVQEEPDLLLFDRDPSIRRTMEKKQLSPFSERDIG